MAESLGLQHEASAAALKGGLEQLKARAQELRDEICGMAESHCMKHDVCAASLKSGLLDLEKQLKIEIAEVSKDHDSTSAQTLTTVVDVLKRLDGKLQRDLAGSEQRLKDEIAVVSQELKGLAADHSAMQERHAASLQEVQRAVSKLRDNYDACLTQLRRKLTCLEDSLRLKREAHAAS